MVVTIPLIILVIKVMVRGAIISAALLTRIRNAYEMGSERESELGLLIKIIMMFSK